jgi:RNA polymerase sigma factor (sigma-70 family)
MAMRPRRVDYERFFLDNLDLINQVVRGIARRHCLSQDETDELRQGIHHKLIEDDYRVLRRFEQRCSLRTFLTAVVARFFLDQRNARWGKWRPSLEARRHGPIAVLLEQLLTRDRVPFDEAVQILKTKHKVLQSEEDLYQLSLRFPHRTPRWFVGDQELVNIARGPAPDEPLQLEALAARALATAAALAQALASLDPQDRLILKMHFQDNLRFSDIARILKMAQKPLYRRKEEVIEVLRRALQAHGISRQDVVEIAGSAETEVEAVFGADELGTVPPRPSVR